MVAAAAAAAGSCFLHSSFDYGPREGCSRNAGTRRAVRWIPSIACHTGYKILECVCGVRAPTEVHARARSGLLRWREQRHIYRCGAFAAHCYDIVIGVVCGPPAAFPSSSREGIMGVGLSIMCGHRASRLSWLGRFPLVNTSAHVCASQ